MTGPGGLLLRYDDELREQGEVDGMAEVDRIGPLWVAKPTPTTGFVTHTDLAGLSDVKLTRLVRAVVGWCHDNSLTEVEWKTRGHDGTPSLGAILARHGFVAQETETVVAGELASLTGDAAVRGASVRRGGSDGDLLDDVTRIAALQSEVFGREVPGIVDRSLARLEGGGSEFWLVETGDPAGRDVVGAGRYDLVPGTRFAGLWGGAVHPAWRGRGVYRALTRARAGAALARGAAYAYADCTEMSRPILERCGLVSITTTTPYVWARQRPGSEPLAEA